MTDRLEDLVRRTEKDIAQLSAGKSTKAKPSRVSLPKVSIAAMLWLAIVVIGIFNFSDVVALVSQPAESKLERDLTTVLNAASGSLNNYMDQHGVLPYVLPNPAIRGLVRYEKRSDFGFTLRASMGNVTMVMDSTATAPYREATPE